MDMQELMQRCEANSDHSIVVFDRDKSDVQKQVIGTVNRGPRGVEAFRNHYSLADRSAARLAGSPFPTIGDGARALIADHDEPKEG